MFTRQWLYTMAPDGIPEYETPTDAKRKDTECYLVAPTVTVAGALLIRLVSVPTGPTICRWRRGCFPTNYRL